MKRAFLLRYLYYGAPATIALTSKDDITYRFACILMAVLIHNFMPSITTSTLVSNNITIIMLSAKEPKCQTPNRDATEVLLTRKSSNTNYGNY